MNIIEFVSLVQVQVDSMALQKFTKYNLMDGTVDELPISPIVSNIDTASYQLNKYVAELLLPSIQS